MHCITPAIYTHTHTHTLNPRDTSSANPVQLLSVTSDAHPMTGSLGGSIGESVGATLAQEGAGTEATIAK